METFTEKAKRLGRIRQRLKRAYGEVERPPVTHPVEHAVRTVLSEEATGEQVEAALERIREHFVDFNDLRVSRPREIREVLGEAFPRASHKARVIPRLLDQVFKRHNSMVWDFLEEMGKIEAREFFEQLEEVRPFVAATMARDCVEAHAFPVDRDVGRVLGRLGLVDTETDSEADMQAFLERAVNSNRAYELHALVKRLAEDVCVVGEPRCSMCPLRRTCPTAEEMAARRARKKKARKKKAKRSRKTKKAGKRKTASRARSGKAGGAGKTSARKSAKGKRADRAKKKPKRAARRKTARRRKRS